MWRVVWQTFAPPVPLSASTVEALLEALRTWAGAEARDIRQHASARGPATTYADDLDKWARRISGSGKQKIPMVSVHLVRKGDAARPDHGKRLRAIVALYRGEYTAVEAGLWRKDKVASKATAVSEGEAGGMPIGVRCCGVDSMPCNSSAFELGATDGMRLQWQAPMPSFPAGRDALLAAMSDWMAAERGALEASIAPEVEASSASAYMKRLEGWMRRPLPSVPKLTKRVEQEAEDAGRDALMRLKWVLQRYRDELRKPPPTDRTDVVAACAVRASRGNGLVLEGDGRGGGDARARQAVGLPDYASHEDQADVMLQAIGELRDDGAASLAVQRTLYSKEQEWRAYRAGTRKARPSPIRLSTPEDRAYVKKLGTLHAQLKRIESAKERLEHYRVFLQIAPDPHQASHAAREANRAAAVEQQETWLDENGRCPCLPHESCGLGCVNYLLGAQAAWYDHSIACGLACIPGCAGHRLAVCQCCGCPGGGDSPAVGVPRPPLPALARAGTV